MQSLPSPHCSSPIQPPPRPSTNSHSALPSTNPNQVYHCMIQNQSQWAQLPLCSFRRNPTLRQVKTLTIYVHLGRKANFYTRTHFKQISLSMAGYGATLLTHWNFLRKKHLWTRNRCEWCAWFYDKNEASISFIIDPSVPPAISSMIGHFFPGRGCGIVTPISSVSALDPRMDDGGTELECVMVVPWIIREADSFI